MLLWGGMTLLREVKDVMRVIFSGIRYGKLMLPTKYGCLCGDLFIIASQ
jgi:hypothetical protein